MDVRGTWRPATAAEILEHLEPGPHGDGIVNYTYKLNPRKRRVLGFVKVVDGVLYTRHGNSKEPLAATVTINPSGKKVLFNLRLARLDSKESAMHSEHTRTGDHVPST
jgi:hypothetical protein